MYINNFSTVYQQKELTYVACSLDCKHTEGSSDLANTGQPVHNRRNQDSVNWFPEQTSRAEHMEWVSCSPTECYQLTPA